MNQRETKNTSKCYLLKNHLKGAVVKGVATHHPHGLFLHHSFMGSSGKGSAKRLDTGQDPERLG